MTMVWQDVPLTLAILGSCGAPCGELTYADRPGNIVAMIQFARIDGAVLLGFALAFMLLNVWRGWSGWRAGFAVVAIVCAAVCLISAQWAQDAWAPLAALNMPATATESDWVASFGTATLVDFDTVFTNFRGIAALCSFLTLMLGIVVLDQIYATVRARLVKGYRVADLRR